MASRGVMLGQPGRAAMVVVAIASLATIATLLMSKQVQRGPSEFEDLEVIQTGENVGLTADLSKRTRMHSNSKGQMLYQIGDQEYLAMNTGSVEDLAMDVQKMLAKEQVLLGKIDKRASDHQRVLIDIQAGQIGKQGDPGPRGYPGPAGFPGDYGPRGPPGDMGDRGAQGPKGIPGPKGDDGDTGPDGDMGDQGAQGPRGPPGSTGREGPRGEEGPVGQNGPPGAPGQMGEMGPPGLAASEGQQGLQGPQGPAGPPGRNGAPGMPGDQGPPGKQGLGGSQGSPGLPGEPGKPGKSQCGIQSISGETMCCGVVTNPVYFNAGTNTIQVDVDTTACNFAGSPRYHASLQAESSHWVIYSAGDIENPSDPSDGATSPNKFRLTLKSNDNIDVNTANSYGWQIRWCGFGTVTKKAPMYSVCCGSTAAGAWNEYYGMGTYVDADTRGCGWTDNNPENQPMYFASVADTSCGNRMGDGCSALVAGVNSIYGASSTGFRVYLRTVSQYSAAAWKANNYGWRLNWCGVKKLPPSSTAAAGFPCTAPRLLQGDGSQTVYSNTGSICCGSTSNNWLDGNDGITIYNTIDTTMCNFKDIKTLITNAQGKLGSISKAAGESSWATTSSPNKFKTSLYAPGVKFWEAKANNWKVQWCAFGTLIN